MLADLTLIAIPVGCDVPDQAQLSTAKETPAVSQATYVLMCCYQEY